MLKSHIEAVMNVMEPHAAQRFLHEITFTDGCEQRSIQALNQYWLSKVKAIPKNTLTEELVLGQTPATFAEWMTGFTENVLPTIQRFDLP
jgi:hypothetical protein